MYLNYSITQLEHVFYICVSTMKNIFKQPSLDGIFDLTLFPDIIFDLKYSTKQLTRYSSKAESESNLYRGKLKKVCQLQNYLFFI